MPYPFIPIQLTLASVSTIGIPSFILSFEPNNERVTGKFLPNVLKKAVPPAITIVINILIIIIKKQTMINPNLNVSLAVCSYFLYLE